jgi:hypothetical protein
MARCPRCRLEVHAFTRCGRCGLMVGWNGLTVLLECTSDDALEKVRGVARRQRSCSEWVEENGQRILHVTYGFSELERLDELLRAATDVERRRLFANGLEVRWPTARNLRAFHAQMRALAESDDEEVRLDTRYPMHLELHH